MRNMIVLAAFAIAAACAPSPAPTAAPTEPAAAAAAADPAAPAATPAPAPVADEASCKTAGGDWRPICRMQKPACVITYKDAGKACTDGSQCEGGRCAAETATATPGATATGKCVTNSDPCGCTTLIADGKTTGTLCVD